MKNLIPYLVLLTVTGCATTIPKPQFYSKYLPLTGMTQTLPRDSALEYCKAISSGAGRAAYQDAINSTATQKTPSEVHCRKDGFGNIRCKEKKPIGSWRLEQYQKKKNESDATTAMLYSLGAAVKKCMAENGYVLKRVCVKNCTIENSRLLNLGMTKQEVLETMNVTPVYNASSRSVDEWHYCKTGYGVDEFVAVYFKDKKLIAMQPYSVTLEDANGLYGSCDNFVSMGSYREPDIVRQLRAKYY